MTRLLKAMLIAMVLVGGLGASRAAEACPMCSVANEDGKDEAANARPRAYMYSILFMLSMPATIFTVFAVTFYRLSQKQAAMNEESLALHRDDSSSGSFESLDS